MVGRFVQLTRGRRIALPAVAIPCVLFLSGCGSSTVTITAHVPDTTGLVAVSSTITSNAQAINDFTAKLVALDAGKPAQGVLQAGDVHQGSIVCTYILNKNGNQYDVSIYVVGRAPGVAALCSSGNQQSLLKQLP